MLLCFLASLPLAHAEDEVTPALPPEDADDEFHFDSEQPPAAAPSEKSGSSRVVLEIRPAPYPIVMPLWKDTSGSFSTLHVGMFSVPKPAVYRVEDDEWLSGSEFARVVGDEGFAKRSRATTVQRTLSGIGMILGGVASFAVGVALVSADDAEPAGRLAGGLLFGGGSVALLNFGAQRTMRGIYGTYSHPYYTTAEMQRMVQAHNARSLAAPNSTAPPAAPATPPTPGPPTPDGVPPDTSLPPAEGAE